VNEPTLGVVLPYWLGRPDLEALGIARQASACGFERLWLGEMATFDVFALATAVANTTSIPRLTVGPIAVGVRSPVAIAMGAASVATLTNRRVDVALGASSPHIVSDWHDRSWKGNAQRTRESVTVLRDLFDGNRAAFSGQHIRTKGFKLRQPQPDSTISVAAFGPRMTQVAAECADEVVLNLVSPAVVAEARAAIDAFAEACGRPAPRLAVWLVCSVEPGPATHHQIASQVAVYLRPPGYGEMFTELGFGDLVRKARSADSRHTLVGDIPPELPAAVAAIGSGPEVLRRIKAYFDAGADHIGLSPATVDDGDGAATLAFIREHAPALLSTEDPSEAARRL
jgi:probable F420-dependent oxidoreductase